MSDYGFGYDGYDQQAQGQQAPSQEPVQGQEPKWFRDYMDKTSKEMKELRQKLAQKDVGDALSQAGYNPKASALFTGDPAKVGEWITAHADVLAKTGSSEEPAGQEQEQQPAGAPASVVSPESQAALARMQAAGAEGAAAPLGGDQEMAAKVAACQTEEELDALMRAQGNRFV